MALQQPGRRQADQRGSGFRNFRLVDIFIHQTPAMRKCGSDDNERMHQLLAIVMMRDYRLLHDKL